MPDIQGPDFRGPNLQGPENEPSLDAVRRADSFIDSLAGGRAVMPQDAADAELAALLGNWRDEMRFPPATDLISEADAVAALNAGRAERRFGPARDRWAVDPEITPRRNRRGLTMVGAAAAAVLCLGGFGAVVAGAGPGDALYGLRTMLFGGSKQTRDVGLAAKTTLNQVQDLIQQGNWDQAQNKLVEVSTQVASIGDAQQKQDLLDQFNDLSAKVVERDPAATAPPGVVYTVPPSAAQLVPAVAPTSTPSAPSITDSTSLATTSAAPTTSDTAATSSSAAETTPTTASTPPESSTGPASTGPASTGTSAGDSATSSAPAATSSTAPAPQSQQTTTPTSAAPTTSAAPASAVQTTAPVEKSAAPTAQAPVTPAQEPKSGLTTTALVPVPVG